MPKGYTETLQELSNSNIAGGFILTAQANLLKEQVKGTQRVAQNFSDKLRTLDANPMTTDEQLQALSEDPEFNEQTSNLSDLTAKYQALTIDVMKRAEQYNQLYDTTTRALGMIGGDQATQLANILGTQQKNKNAVFDKQSELADRMLTRKVALLNIISTGNEIKKQGLEIKTLLQEPRVADLAARMTLSDSYLEMNLAYNQGTGTYDYKRVKKGETESPLEKFKNEMIAQYGDDPEFAKAWLYVEKKIQENTKNYQHQISSYQPDNSMTGKFIALNNIYDGLQKASIEKNRYEFGQTDDLIEMRNKYNENVAEGVKENFGESLKTIDLIDDTDEIGKRTKKAALYIHDTFYDKTNPEGYWTQYQKLKKYLGKEGIDAKNIITISDGFTTSEIDFSTIITNELKDGKYQYIDPRNPSTYPTIPNVPRINNSTNSQGKRF